MSSAGSSEPSVPNVATKVVLGKAIGAVTHFDRLRLAQLLAAVHAQLEG
jgi:hypothetical protein